VIGKKQVPKYFADAPSDCKMAKVPVQDDSPISDSTPISKSIYGEYVLQSDFKKASPSIEGHSPFHEPTKSKGLTDEEVQFVMSQIYLLSEKESGTNKRKTEVPTYDFQTPPNISPQRSKFLVETSITQPPHSAVIPLIWGKCWNILSRLPQRQGRE
jgi:hypothetical protein